MRGYPEWFPGWWNHSSPDLERFERSEGIDMLVERGRYNNVVFFMKVPQQLMLTAAGALQERPVRTIKRDVAIPVLRTLPPERLIELLREKCR